MSLADLNSFPGPIYIDTASTICIITVFHCGTCSTPNIRFFTEDQWGSNLYLSNRFPQQCDHGDHIPTEVQAPRRSLRGLPAAAWERNNTFNLGVTCPHCGEHNDTLCGSMEIGCGCRGCGTLNDVSWMWEWKVWSYSEEGTVDMEDLLGRWEWEIKRKRKSEG